MQKVDSYKKLLSLLPSSMTRGVSFCYNKNDSLNFVLTHPAYKIEFNHKPTLINTLLKKLISIDPTCECIDAEKLTFFVTNKVPFKEPKVSSEIFYEERSKGKFINFAVDKKLHDEFEKIRQLICSKIS